MHCISESDNKLFLNQSNKIITCKTPFLEGCIFHSSVILTDEWNDLRSYKNCIIGVLIKLFLICSRRTPNGGTVVDDVFIEKEPFGQGFIERETITQNNPGNFGGYGKK